MPDGRAAARRPGAASVDLTVYTQDDPAFPAGVDARPRRRPRRQLAPRHRDRADAASASSTASRSSAPSAGRGPTGSGSPASTDLGADLPVMRPGCGSLSVDPDRVDELRVRFEGGRLRSRRVELAELEDEFEAMFARGWTDGLPVVPPTEERVLRDARGHDARRRTSRRHRAARPRRRHRREGRHRRRDGRLPARVPAVGAHRGRGDLHRRVQHPRRAGHDDAGRPGDRRQRPGHARDRDERRRQRPRPGQPGQPDDRPGRAARRAQRRRRPARRASTGPPTATPASSRSASASTPTRRSATLAESRGATPGADAVTVFAGEGPRCVVDQKSRTPESLAALARRRACGRVHHPSSSSASTPSSCSAPSTAGCSPRPAGTATGSLAELDARLQIPGDELVARRRRHGRGRARTRSPARRCRSSGPAASCSPTPVAAPGCSRPSSAAGPTARSAASRSPGRCGTMTHALRARSDGRAHGRRAPAARPAGGDRRADASACSTSPSRAATSSSTGSRAPGRRPGPSVQRYRKPTFTKPAPVDLRHEIATQCDLVIEALAD